MHAVKNLAGAMGKMPAQFSGGLSKTPQQLSKRMEATKTMHPPYC